MPEAADGTPKKPASNLVVRLATGLFLAPLIVALLYLGPPWGFELLVWVAILIAGSELAAMTLPVSLGQRVWLVAAALIIAGAILHAPAFLLVAVTGVVMAGMVIGLAVPEPMESAATRSGWLVAGPLYIGGLLATIALLRRLDHGGAWVLLSMMLSWLADTGGYFAGRAFGKHPLAPRVSPKKTVEGAVGGLGGAIVGVLLAHFFFLPEIPLGSGIALAIVAGGLGQVGDLCESLIKRSTGVKDSGWIVPGHGGLLDRIDALLFTAPATWIYATWLLGS